MATVLVIHDPRPVAASHAPYGIHTCESQNAPAAGQAPILAASLPLPSMGRGRGGVTTKALFYRKKTGFLRPPTLVSVSPGNSPHPCPLPTLGEGDAWSAKPLMMHASNHLCESRSLKGEVDRVCGLNKVPNNDRRQDRADQG